MTELKKRRPPVFNREQYARLIHLDSRNLDPETIPHVPKSNTQYVLYLPGFDLSELMNHPRARMLRRPSGVGLLAEPDPKDKSARAQRRPNT